MKVFYVRDWGRPFGIEPKVFASFEEANLPNTSEENPFGCSIEQFETREKALAFIKKYER